MSLLEDVFLEDEAGEAQELERVVEGDELDERPRSPNSNDNSEKEDEAEEDKRVVDHTAKAKRVVKNPRFVLNPARLTGPRGIQIIPEHFKDFKFKGKGHEREDLDLVLKKLEHWAYRLYPKFMFDDCLKKIETLGKKRPVMVHLHKIRTDQYLSEETVQQQDSSGDEAAQPQEEDEFDRLLQQQIELARSTPAPGSTKKEVHTPMTSHRSPLMLPKVTMSPSISDEQKERMIRNRRLAEERRLARANQSNNSDQNKKHSTEPILEETEETNTADAEKTNENDKENISENNDDIDRDELVVKKHTKSYVINSDSSDDENIVAVNKSITVDVHSSVLKSNSFDQNKKHSTESILEEIENTNTADAENPNENNKENNSENNDEIDRDEPVVKKHTKSNVVNSASSDDENILAVNESITVDVRGSVLKEVEDTEELNSHKEMMVVEPIESDHNVTSADTIDNSKLHENGKELETDVTEIRISNDTNSKLDKPDSDATAVISDNIILKENDETEKEKKYSVPLTEEFMDVDFTDDF